VDATASSSLPPYSFNDSKIEISGKSNDRESHALIERVSQGYFRVLRIPIKAGRAFAEEEINDARKVAVVNEAFVSSFLRNEDPIAQRIKLAALATPTGTPQDPWFEIVGVVADVTNSGLQAPVQPEVWIPYTVAPSGTQALMVRTEQSPLALMNDLRQVVWATDAGVPLALPGALEDRIAQRLYAGPRFAFVLMAIFGCLGLALVTVGVYSVLAYATSRKTHEIGVRIALGAERADVLRLVVRAGLRLVAAGIGIGLLVSLLLGRAVQADLAPGVKSYDPATLAGTTLLLIVTAAFACWIPARRAARVDPMVALRYE
jgi:putative ABC transport system permease protein